MWSIGAVYSTVTLILPDLDTPLECVMCRMGLTSNGGGSVTVVVGGGATVVVCEGGGIGATGFTGG